MRGALLLVALVVGVGGAVGAAAAEKPFDGPVLLYASDWLGATRIFAADPSGERAVGQLTFGPLKDHDCGAWACGADEPLASPNGRLVAYVQEGALWVTRPDGSRPRRLQTYSVGAGFVQAFAWAPDSSKIAYGGLGALRMVSASGREDIMVTRADVEAIAWSPDGRAIAVQDGERISILRGTVLMRLAVGASFFNPSVAWSRSGRIAFLSGPRGSTRVVTVNADGRGPLRDLGAGTSHAWSPDGRLMAVSTSAGIELVDPVTLRRRRLTRDQGFDLEWSPDGRILAYIEGYIDRTFGQEEDAGDLRTVTLGGRVRTIVPASRRYGGQIISLAWARPPAGTRYRAPQRDDGVFASAPVSALAADGDRVGYAACMNVSAWRPSTGDLRGVEVPDGDMCYASVRGEIDGLAMAGERIAWRHRRAGNNRWEWSLHAHSLATSAENVLASGYHGAGRGDWWDVIAGDGSLLVFSTPPFQETKNLQFLRRVDGVSCPCPEIKAAASGSFGTVSFFLLDVDDERVVVRRYDNLVLVLDRSGTTSIAISGSPWDAQLSGNELVLPGGGALLHHEVVRGALLHRWPLSRGWDLQDAARGLVAYAVDGSIRLLRLRDGADAVVAPGSLAAFFDRGLAYAEGARVRVIPFDRLPLR
jgi:hypothetical protein